MHAKENNQDQLLNQFKTEKTDIIVFLVNGFQMKGQIENFDETLQVKWEHFAKVRQEVLKGLEEARAAKVIGNSLEARITVTPKDEETKSVLESIPHIHQLFIVSDAVISDTAHQDAGSFTCIDLFVEKHSGEKCNRCWTFNDDVGEKEEHPDLCVRCATIVDEHYGHLK